MKKKKYRSTVWLHVERYANSMFTGREVEDCTRESASKNIVFVKMTEFILSRIWENRFLSCEFTN